MDNFNFIEKCEKKLEDKFKSVDEIAYFNQVKILNAFNDLRVAQRHFNGTTGYGYDDEGRDCLGKLYAKMILDLAFGCGFDSNHQLQHYPA